MGCMGCSETLDPLWINEGVFGLARWGYKKYLNRDDKYLTDYLFLQSVSLMKLNISQS